HFVPTPEPIEPLAEADPFTEEITVPLTPIYQPYTDTITSSDPFTIHHSPFTIQNFSPTFTRTEQTDPAWSYTGTWSNTNLAQASGGNYWYNATAGSTAELTFDGTWLSLGFITNRWSGQATITIDGNDYGTLDLYRNEENATHFLFDGLPPGTHTVEIEVLGTANPFAGSARVQLDYADYGDGSLLPDGHFEEDDPRLLTSNGWTTVAYAGASGGNYIRANTGTAWFPFAGDSFTLHSLAHSNGDKARLFVDGVYLDTIDLFAPVFPSAALTRTFSYEGLGSGPHILQIASYQNQVSIDKLTAPGTAPFTDPNPPVTGVTRFEADHPTIQYNGVPFTQTATTWVRIDNIFGTRASEGEYIYSATANDTISWDFTGDWLGIGFATDRASGQAEIRIDGQLVETIDLYSRYDDTTSRYFRDLGAGAHTVAITVLGTSHPEAIGTDVSFDFFDVWDGQPLPEGTFEEDDERLTFSNGWGRTLNAEASGGAFASSTSNVTAWFPFTGDSFTYHARTRYSYQDVELRLNGQSLGQYDIYSYEDSSRTYSFDNLGVGPHVLEIRQYREAITVDAVSSPAIEPAWEPPAPPPVVRYEENHPDMRYNSQPFHTMPQSWALDSTAGWTSSGSNSVYTSLAGNIWSLDFDGQWVNIGLRSSTGTADIRINGVSQGMFDTSGGVNGAKNFPFALDPGTHLVEVEVISGTVSVDYMDVWQGDTMDAGWYDAKLEDDQTGAFHFSRKGWWLRGDDIYAYNGDFLVPFVNANANVWFNFVGTDLTILGNQRDSTTLQVVIDGVDYGEFDMSTPAPFRGQPIALHFPDLGEGAHVVQVFPSRNGGRIDAFEVNPDGFYSYMPEIKWYDTAATEELTTTYGTGFASTIALGDLNGDGDVELVAPALNGRLYVYRGDGADTGDGTPILWTSDVAGPVAEPALADLNGDGKAEIVVTGVNGTFALSHDGNVLWHNPDVASFYSTEQFGWGGASIGNLDLSPE
ncbi:MAG: VCBS repeat-containing protein, partial [Anaerolineales bacterium]|nr:VCBS repeat-containing protein [Anaerolineales bacterium]